MILFWYFILGLFTVWKSSFLHRSIPAILNQYNPIHNSYRPQKWTTGSLLLLKRARHDNSRWSAHDVRGNRRLIGAQNFFLSGRGERKRIWFAVCRRVSIFGSPNESEELQPSRRKGKWLEQRRGARRTGPRSAVRHVLPFTLDSCCRVDATDRGSGQRSGRSPPQSRRSRLRNGWRRQPGPPATLTTELIVTHGSK